MAARQDPEKHETTPRCSLDFLNVEHAKDLIKLFQENSLDINDSSGYNGQNVLFGVKNKHIHDLVKAGADPNHQDIHGRTPLHEAMDYNFLSAIVLLENGADPTIKDSCGRTPLHLAVHNEHPNHHVDSIADLLYYGADVNAVDDNGNTAMHLARVSEHVFILALHGADMTILNNEGRTPAEVAKHKYAKFPNRNNRNALSAMYSIERMRVGRSTKAAAKTGGE